MTPLSRPVPAVVTRRRGFSLVLSLTVMSMLLLLCIAAAAMLAVELRVARATVSQAKARLNALAGARIALGEVQRLLGPDRRITANAAILGTNGTSPEAWRSAAGVARPRYVGVWKGLVANALPAVSPVAGYAADHDRAFVGWLASGTESGVALTSMGEAGLTWMKGAAGVPDAGGELRLLHGGKSAYAGASSLANDDALHLYARPETIPAADGSAAGEFAWVAMDENQKARVDLRDMADDGLEMTARGVFRAGAARAFFPGYAADGTALGKWQSYLAQGQRSPSLGWAGLINDPYSPGWFPEEPGEGVPSRALRHDFTTQSVSLLTDAANGGLKRDLSLLALLSDADFDALTGAGDTPKMGGIAGFVGFDADTPSSGRNAWWRTSVTGALPLPGAMDDASKAAWPLWSDVREWARFPTVAKAQGGEGGAMLGFSPSAGPFVSLISFDDQKAFMQAAVDAKEPDRRYHGYWRQPVLAKYRLEVRFAATETSPGSGQYNLNPHVNVVAQLWNPYNVALRLSSGTTDNYIVRCPGFPLAAEIKTQGTPAKSTVFGFDFNDPTHRMGGFIPLYATGEAEFLAPGEVRTFSYKAAVTLGTMDESQLTLEPGYAPSGGVKARNWAVLSGLSATDSISIKVRQNRDFQYSTTPYCALAIYRGPKTNYAPTYLTTYGALDTKGNLMRMLGGAEEQVYYNVAALTGNVGQLNPAMVFEMRLKAEAKSGAAFDDERAWLGETPFLHRPTGLAESDTAGRDASPFEFVAWGVGYEDTENAKRLEVTENPRVPGAPGALGYLGTGYASATGVGNFVYHRVPLHPPVGLFDLRHARLGGGVRSTAVAGGGSTPPAERVTGITAVHDAFGNSLMSPWVKQADVVAASTVPCSVRSGTPFKPCDMSWIMNAALADTWFVSSLGDWDRGVAAELFRAVGKNAAGQLAEFFAGTKALPNGRLSPVGVKPEDLVDGSGVATPEAFRKAAGHFLVEGGFNINSTSVRAWRAFLASLHTDQPAPGTVTKLAKLDSSGKLADAAMGAAAPVVAPTGSVLNDDPSANPAAEPARRANGGRALSDAQLDKLAQMMVNEVKKRGPFLSLGEFLNRRLESGALGAKGAAQAAIDNAGLNDHRKGTGRDLAVPGLPNDQFAQSVDASGVGLPGWLSQADLLAPLANAMTPRGDTFTVRVSGSVEGARCNLEVTLRRTYDYVDGSESAQTEFSSLKKVSNRAFGRRFAVASVRVLEDSAL